MAQLDPSWSPIFILLGVVVTAAFTYLGVRSSSKAGIKAKEVESSVELIQEWKSLKSEIEKDAQARHAQLQEMLHQERDARKEFEERMAHQMEEVLLHFAMYVEWARNGAKSPPPFIPDWIYQKLTSFRK